MQKIIPQDLTFFIEAKEIKPHLLSLDFARCSGMVPGDWELARQPIGTNNIAQLIFTNGIAITAEPQRIILAQPIRNVDRESILIPEIARKYTNVLSNMEFEAIRINLRSYVPFEEQDSARQYITQTLLSPGAWQSVGETPPHASVELVYNLQRAPFYLKITEAALQETEEKVTPIIIFNGSFSYQVDGESNTEKLAVVHSVINNWQSDLSDYQNIINNKFLAQVAQPELALPTNGYNPEANNLFAVSA
ncbi:MAG: hypothetical protein KI793_26575 [Rivularia sp. (in: Bacteria)]|nr:hypothetical protein [Rivularia sp. MS3]